MYKHDIFLYLDNVKEKNKQLSKLNQFVNYKREREKEKENVITIQNHFSYCSWASHQSVWSSTAQCHVEYEYHHS